MPSGKMTSKGLGRGEYSRTQVAIEGERCGLGGLRIGKGR